MKNYQDLAGWPMGMDVSIVVIINSPSPQWAAPFSRLAPEGKSQQAGNVDASVFLQSWL